MGRFELQNTAREFRVWFAMHSGEHVAFRLRGVAVPITDEHSLYVTHHAERMAAEFSAGMLAYGGGTEPVELILEKDAMVRIVVPWADQIPVGAPVWVDVRAVDLPSAPIDVGAEVGSPLVGEARDRLVKNGSVSIKHLPEGKYEVVVIAPPVGAVRAELLVKDGGGSSTVELPEGGLREQRKAAGPGRSFWIAGVVPGHLGPVISDWAWVTGGGGAERGCGWLAGDVRSGRWQGSGMVSTVNDSGAVCVWDVQDGVPKAWRRDRVVGVVTGQWMKGERDDHCGVCVAMTTPWGGEGKVVLPEPRANEVAAVHNITSDGRFEISNFREGVYVVGIMKWRRQRIRDRELWEIALNRGSVRLVRVVSGVTDIGEIELSEEAWEPFRMWKTRYVAATPR